MNPVDEGQQQEGGGGGRPPVHAPPPAPPPARSLSRATSSMQRRLPPSLSSVSPPLAAWGPDTHEVAVEALERRSAGASAAGSARTCGGAGHAHAVVLPTRRLAERWVWAFVE